MIITWVFLEYSKTAGAQSPPGLATRFASELVLIAGPGLFVFLFKTSSPALKLSCSLCPTTYYIPELKMVEAKSTETPIMNSNNNLKASVHANEVPRSLRAKFERAGQPHVFSFVDSMSPEQFTAFMRQLESFDVDRLLKSLSVALKSMGNTAERAQLGPLRAEDLIIPGEEKSRVWDIGIDAIKLGKVAVVTLAGGQGTRLGSSQPKGCYNIGLPSNLSLFELQAQRLLRLANIAKVDGIPWYVMTSGATHEETMAFFRQHNFFGIPESYLMFFKQGELPAVTREGKLILKEKHSLAMSPNGNGGIYPALLKERVIDDMKMRGIDYIHMYCVDNALVRVADPYFMGSCIMRGTDCAAKSILKTDPAESVGIFCRRKDGKVIVAEYSELDPSLSGQVDANGKLLFNQANIANHFFTLPFLEAVANDAALPYHLALKKIPSIDEEGNAMSTPIMGFKLEAFIFDVFEKAKKPIIYQGIREEEFAPLKNAPGADRDTPEYCRQLLLDLHATWLKNAGAIVEGPVEICPLLSYSGEGLERFKGQRVYGYLKP